MQCIDISDDFKNNTLRSMADSNRRTRFCRPLPSHSANRPFSGCKYREISLARKPGAENSGLSFHGNANCLDMTTHGRPCFGDLHSNNAYPFVLFVYPCKNPARDMFQQMGALVHLLFNQTVDSYVV